ncbi:hypothetical protein DL95DRAFT_412254 [Leptodontidium sp. 2 PMI_412]|nr:hypothetical protein DL95DRAFT_412254 [Leptodontidium sp. 2 PMI_412]
MKCTATLIALVLATLSSAQVIGNPFFSCPAGTTGGCCLSFNSGGTGVNCGPVIPGPIPGHEKEFVCAFRPREQKSCCTTGGDAIIMNLLLTIAEIAIWMRCCSSYHYHSYHYCYFWQENLE